MSNTNNHPFPALNFQDFISVDGEQLFTDSIKVAAVFGKPHDEVLRIIRSLSRQLPAEFNACNFARIADSDTKGNNQISYRITRDGFALLASRFTGKRALTLQMAVINAFNAKAVSVKNLHEGLKYQIFQKEIIYRDRKKRVSASARDMRRWQDDKPAMLAEMNALLGAIQPSLAF
jgi:Rha family phage regulatory protein